MTRLKIIFVAAAALAADKAAPAVIPCPNNLPCISEETQAQGAEAVRGFITDKFGVQFLTGFLGVAAVACVIFIIVGGMQLHLALGNEEDIKKAKTTLYWAVIGLIVAILSVAIVRIVINLPL